MSSKKNLIITILLLFTGLAFFGLTDNIRTILIPVIKDEYGASDQMQGLAASMISAGGLLSGFFATFLLQRFSIKTVALAGLLSFVCALMSISLTDSFFMTYLGFTVIRVTYNIYQQSLNGIASRFGKRAGRMLTFTHFAYGVGSIAGPVVCRFLINDLGYEWRHVFPLTSVIFVVPIVLAILYKDDIKTNDGKVKFATLTYKQAFSTPAIPLLALFGTFMGNVEMAVIQWGPLHFQSAFGVDPLGLGASILSVFFICFTLSRLLGSFIIDKIGYVRYEYISMIGSLAMLTIGMFLGEDGIWVFALSGLFIGGIFPGYLALITDAFRNTSAIALSMTMSFSGILSVGLQYTVGLANEYIGPTAGFPLTVIYGYLSLIPLTIFTVYRRRLKKKEEEDKCKSTHLQVESESVDL